MTLGRVARLRVRYFIAGAVLAALWVGHSNEPPWAHALRIGLVLATVRPLVILSRRYYARRLGSGASQTRAIVVLIGTRLLALAGALLIGTLIERLITHQSDSVHWLTLLRFGLLLATIPLQLRLLRNRPAGRRAATMLNRARWNWLLLAKAALVGAALGLEVALDGVLGKRADLVVAALLLIAVATLGPRLHARLFGIGGRRPTREDEPAPAAAPSSPGLSSPGLSSPGLSSPGLSSPGPSSAAPPAPAQPSSTQPSSTQPSSTQPAPAAPS
jgi:GLTT repeat (6 copies)